MLRVQSSPALLLVLCLAAFASLTFARSVRNPSHRSRSRQEGNNQQETNDAHSLLCPSVVCAPLPDSCQSSEYIVMRVPFTTNSGQRAEVRCQSCDYCLDLPSEPSDTGRARRSPTRPRHHRDCTRVTCPDVTSHCRDVRRTDVLLGNTVCKHQCLACYDVTVFDRTRSSRLVDAESVELNS